MFTRRGATWSQQAYIKASNTGEAGTDGNFGDGDQFGFSLSLSDDGNTLAVGANAEDSNADGDQRQPGRQLDAVGGRGLRLRAHAATTWTQQAYVKAANTTAQRAVRLFGGAQRRRQHARGRARSTRAASSRSHQRSVRAVPAGRNGTGAIYVFTRSGSTWTQQAYLKASNAEDGDSLGVIVSISDDGNTVAAGILDEDCMADRRQSVARRATTTAKDDTSVGAAVRLRARGDAVGAAGVHQGVEHRQGRLVRLAPADQRRRQHAGRVRRSSRTAPRRGSTASRTMTPRRKRAPSTSSRAPGRRWAQKAYVKSSNNEAFDEFGSSVALSRDGRTMAVGARGEDSGARGVNGNQADNSMKEAGAVYVFTYNPSAAGRTPVDQVEGQSMNRFRFLALAAFIGWCSAFVALGAQGGGAGSARGDQQARGKALYIDKCASATRRT